MKRQLAASLTLLAIVTAACTTASSPSTAANESPSPPGTSIEDEWDRLGIADYRIVYSSRNLNGMGGSPGDGLYSVVVRDNKVVECDVEPSIPGDDGCAVMLQSGPSPTPVGMLFNRLAAWEPALTAVEYHSDYPLPVRISYDDPDTADEEFEIRVIEFGTADA